jgi:NlpC/P60 family putative phage cell wall peptidase
VFRWRPQHAAKHLGILTGDNEFLHAYEGQAVMISPLVPQWRRRIAGVFAFPDKTS